MTKQTPCSKQEGKLLRMFLKCASGYTLRDSAGRTDLKPEDQTEENIGLLRELVNRRLIREFREPDFKSLREYIEKIRSGPHPYYNMPLNTPERYDANNEYLNRKLDLNCTDYGLHVVASLIADNGRFFLGHPSWECTADSVLGFQEFLEQEEFFCHLVLGDSPQNYESDNCMRTSDLVHILKKEKLIEENKRTVKITEFGKRFYETLFRTFDTYSKSKETQERWSRIEER